MSCKILPFLKKEKELFRWASLLISDSVNARASVSLLSGLLGTFEIYNPSDLSLPASNLNSRVMTLNHLLLSYPLYQVLNLIKILLQSSSKWTFIYHSDLILPDRLDPLPAFVQLIQTYCRLETESPDDYILHVQARRPSGRISHQTLYAHLSDARLLWVTPKQPLVQSPPPTSDPTAKLTFNLSLTSSQKEAKDAIVLPHLSATETTVIHYQHDPGDALDSEEDLDDDLDI